MGLSDPNSKVTSLFSFTSMAALSHAVAFAANSDSKVTFLNATGKAHWRQICYKSAHMNKTD